VSRLRSATALVLAGALVVAALAACRNRSGGDGRGTGPSASSGGSPEVDAGTFDKAALLRAFADCALGTYREFAVAAGELDRAVIAAESDPAKLQAARDAWTGAVTIWQRAELFQFGPAAMTGSPGARDMRDPIYAWPLVSRCQIEQTLADKVYEVPDFASLGLVSTRTLAALEYLLFHPAADNACPPTDPLNAQGRWAALGEAEIGKRKLAYARVVASDVLVRAQRLVDAWDPARENFVATFAGAPNATFSSQQMAFNAVSDAMFYLDDQMKNMKVGTPAGLVPACAAPPCVDAVESPWAKRSKEHMRANLAAYEQLVKGCGPGGAGLGFDDLLAAIGAPHVADQLLASVTAVRAALDGLTEPTFQDDLRNNPAGVRALFDALRGNATVMKSDFVTVLDLEIPKAVVGDND
jgi:predicted lipoprotein